MSHNVLSCSYKSPKNWYALSADTKAGLWSFVSADGTELAAVTDTTMKADIFLTIVMMVRGDSITVEANGESLSRLGSVGHN